MIAKSLVAAAVAVSAMSANVVCAQNKPASGAGAQMKADKAAKNVGKPAAENEDYDRKIRIGLKTKSVNIDGKQVVKFIIKQPDGSDKTFMWNFDVVNTTVDLNKVAPEGVLNRPVKVWVGADPDFRQ